MEDQTPIDSISVTSRRPLLLRIRQKIRPYLSFGAICLLIIAVLVPISIALGTPTPEEIIKNEITLKQEAYAEKETQRKEKLDEIKTIETEIKTIETKMIKIAEQTANLRVVLDSFQ